MFFDATNIDTTSQFDAIPAGDYEAMVTGSAMKATRDGSGEYLELTLEIQSGQFQGRRLWDRLNLRNRNAKAVEIAQKQLAQLCHAVNVLQVQTPEQLHNRPFVMKVSVKNDPERGMSNEVKGYKARAAMQQQAPAFQAPRAAAQAPAYAAPTQQAAPAAGGIRQGGPLPWAA